MPPGTETTASALHSDGVLRLPLPAEVASDIAAIFSASQLFFRRTIADKSSSALPEECGYRPMGIEYSQSPQRPDLIESFTASPRIQQPAIRMLHPDAQRLYERMMSVLGALERLAEDLVVSIADAVGRRQHRTELHGGLHRWSRLQVNYSRPRQAGPGSLVHDPHEDGNMLTLACATAPGLEIRKEDGSYTPIHADGTAVIVMPGEILSLLTDCYIRPLFHRVRPDAMTDERLALLLFVDLEPTFCHPWAPGSTGDALDIANRVRHNVRRFGLHGFADE